MSKVIRSGGEKLTATEEVLAAAAKLANYSISNEFTEWDLSVVAWSLNKNRWGLRGYEDKYPDHKRVMNEIMAKGTQKVLGRSWLERTKPNHYKLTSLGLVKAQSLRNVDIKTEERSLHEYEAIKPYIFHPVFEKYCSDINEPKTWLGVAAFLGLNKNDPDVLERKLKEINGAIESSLTWLKSHKQETLVRDGSSPYITKSKLLKLHEFLSAIEVRFKLQFDKIRSKS